MNEAQLYNLYAASIVANGKAEEAKSLFEEVSLKADFLIEKFGLQKEFEEYQKKYNKKKNKK